MRFSLPIGGLVRAIAVALSLALPTVLAISAADARAGGGFSSGSRGSRTLPPPPPPLARAGDAAPPYPALSPPGQFKGRLARRGLVHPPGRFLQPAGGKNRPGRLNKPPPDEPTLELPGWVKVRLRGCAVPGAVE